MDIRDKVVLVTGASGGIGLATARSFAGEGAKVALVARSADKLNEIADGLRREGCEAIAIAADLRDAAQVKQAVAETTRHFGRIDILINNAGQSAADMIADINLDDFRQLTDLNVFAPLAAMQAVIPVMREHGGGLILNVSSMVSKMRIPGLAAYAATKAALNALTDTARVELAADNIRVILVFPRTTATDLGKNSLGNAELRQRQRERAHAQATVDTAEFAAGKILAAAIVEPDEQYMDA
jgi:short-subunit dehydrogenase